jgi:predicted nucleotidyltransferase
MDRDAVISTLRAHEAELKKLGVLHAALFGSTARGEAGPDSDIDIAVDIAGGAVRDVFAYAGLKRQVAELFEGTVDVVDRASLRPGIKESAETDMLYAF